MIIFAGKRKSGKTTEAIKLASSTHSILIEPTTETAKCVQRQSHEMGYPVQVISAEQYFHRRDRGEHPHYSVVIDELDIVLERLFGCNVIMATTTGCEIKSEANDIERR